MNAARKLATRKSPRPAPLSRLEKQLADALQKVWDLASEALEVHQAGNDPLACLELALTALDDVCEHAAEALADLPMDILPLAHRLN